MSTYFSCPMMTDFYINFTGQLEKQNVITFCCEPIEDKPCIEIGDSAADTLRDLIDYRLRFINEGHLAASVNVRENFERVFSKGCISCDKYQNREWRSADGRITYVNLSMYPSPCQSRCIYCGVHEKKQDINTLELKEEYEKIFDVIDYALRCGVIAPYATWQVSCGEITIHPYRERIIKLVEDRAVCFYTNCFKYDETIANILKLNPRSSINLSIDAGTEQTWHQVKGVNNFEQVAMNLTKYHIACQDPKQITLKYIVLPGINDSKEDYSMLIEMMKLLKINHLQVSRDVTCEYKINQKETEQLAIATARLLVELYKNGMTHACFTYTGEELSLIQAIANKLLA